MRLFVQLPMKTRSIAMSSMRVPAARPMYSSARSSPSSLRLGDAPGDRHCLAGLVPQVTCGAGAEASTRTSASKLAPGSEG